MHSTAMARHARMARSTEYMEHWTTNIGAGNIPAPAHTFARADPARFPPMTPHARRHDKSRKPFQPQKRTPAAAPFTPIHVALEPQLCRQQTPPKSRSSRPGYRLGPSRDDSGSRSNVLAKLGVDVDQDAWTCVSLARPHPLSTTSPGSDALYAPGNDTPLGLLVPLPLTVSWKHVR